MSVKLLRKWPGVLKQANFACQHQRHFLIPPKGEEGGNVRVVKSAFAPQLVYKYNPLKYYLSKLRMLKLRWTWDPNFKEHDFLEKSKHVAVSLTDNLRMRDMKKMDDFSTSNVYYQMANESINFPHDSCVELLRFRKQDMRQVVPINVHLQKILGLKYAIIDVVMVGLRHVADCETDADLETMKKALVEMEPELKVQLEDPSSQLPYVFIELFLRFRRNYSNADHISGQELANHTNRWLVSVYKICRFNIFTVPPTT
ncbi:uncharacterized protein LOC117783061 [Drosophila innubila]|uniref:uncharacterized protein LOC117783061 n=1 Tax=Drosophila innubila TaxID=198719 RepID=UPI00148D85CE|nr:uncharacterized protein LOC117783061 [Drosophila innubila]